MTDFPSGLTPAPDPSPHFSTAGRPSYQCVACGDWYPDIRFPYRGTDNRCTYCIAKENDELKRGIIQKEAKKAYSQLLKLAKNELTKVPTMERFLVSLLDQWGSLEAFCEEWFIDHQDSRRKYPGSKVVLDSKRAIAGLILKHNQNKPPEEVAEMSDEDLAEELTRVAMASIDGEKMKDAKWALIQAFAQAANYGQPPTSPPGIPQAAEGSVESLPPTAPSDAVLPDDS
jgi:DNA-directed RNA polymerase subunit RPC12/RpoP